MARTAITLRTFLANDTTSLPDPTGDVIDQANGMNLALADTGIPVSKLARQIILRVHNTAAAPHNVIIRAGAYPPAFRKDLGDLTVAVTNATTKWVGPLESARFAQSDGSINVDFDASFTGDITAFLVPGHSA